MLVLQLQLAQFLGVRSKDVQKSKIIGIRFNCFNNRTRENSIAKRTEAKFNRIKFNAINYEIFCFLRNNICIKILMGQAK